MNKFLSLRTKSWLKRNKTLRNTIAYQTAQSVGVVFSIDNESSLPSIDLFIHKLQNDNKKVTVLAYYPNKIELYSHKYDCFTPQNISFWGNFKTDKVSEFVNESFDYLFHLDDKPSTIVQGILAQSHAKCRIGKYADASDPYYEFMINTKEKDYLQEMYEYTSMLN